MWEFYSYTKGGRLLKKGLQAAAMTMEVSFEYDNKGKLAFMVYPGGRRVKYTYDNMERQTSVKHVYMPVPGNPEVETDLVNGVTYGIAGEMKTMSWLAGTTQWASPDSGSASTESASYRDAVTESMRYKLRA